MAAAIGVDVGGAALIALYGVPVAHRWLVPRAARGAPAPAGPPPAAPVPVAGGR